MDLENLLNSNSSSSEITPDIDSEDLINQVQRRDFLEFERYKSDTKDRKWLARWTVIIVSTWLSIVLAVLILNKIFSLGLSDAVLITLLGTTTLNVLGLSFIVLRGHFTARKG